MKVKALTCMHTQSPHRVQLLVTPWTVACQAPLSVEYFRQEYWSELPFPPPGDLPTQWLNLHWQVGSLPLAPRRSPIWNVGPHLWQQIDGSQPNTNNNQNYQKGALVVPSQSIPESFTAVNSTAPRAGCIIGQLGTSIKPSPSPLSPNCQDRCGFVLLMSLCSCWH